MQQHSNAYIVGFAAAVCLVCSVVVSTSAVALKERQEQNKVLDRQKKVLTVAGLMAQDQEITAGQVQTIFDESIRARAIDLETGAIADDIDAGSFDQRKAAKDPATSASAPANRAGVTRLPTNAVVYERVDQGEVTLLILPIEGKGLWSTMYGFIALAPDTTTIKGITFYEHGETPGLGGEIENPSWTNHWIDRQAFDAQGQPVIEVIKGAAGKPDADPYRVDGMSGATLTGRGVTSTVRFWLSQSGFKPYLERFRAERGAA